MTNASSYGYIHSFEFQNVIYDVFSKKPLNGPQPEHLIERIKNIFYQNEWRLSASDEAVSTTLRSGHVFYIKRSPTLLPSSLEQYAFFFTS